MTDITELAQSRLDFTRPLETESGEPVKHVCHDVIEYKSARVCVDVETGIVYSSPYVGLKIRNVSTYAAVRKFTEEAALAYHEHEQGWISDMKCGDRSHEYLSFVRDPKNILALEKALEKAQQQTTESENRVRKQNRHICELFDDNTALRQRIADLEESHAQVIQSRDHYKHISEEGLKQLAESSTVTDWIEHDGKWRPESLGLDELVYLKTRKQELKIPYPAGKVKGWMNTGGDMDVMAYKLASPQASTVTVKLPEVRITVAESRRRNMTWRELGAYNEGADVAAERIGKELTAKGIKWEAE